MRTLLLFALISFACNKRSSNDWLAAKVIATADINCGKPVLQFQDMAALQVVTGQPGNSALGLSLSQNDNVDGRELFVRICATRPDETFACITFGPTIPNVVVLKAKSR